MKLSISPAKLSGTVRVPGSKSHTIRAIAIATLARGASVVKEPLVSADTLTCLTAASTLGAWIKRGDDSAWKICGTGGKLLQPSRPLNFANSGTGARIFAALASLADFPVVIDGDESLRSRPMGPLLDSLDALGVKVESHSGKCPIRVQGPLDGGEALVDGESSQFLSALLLAAPLAKQDTLLLVKDLKERPYVDITLEWLRRQNIIHARNEKYFRFEICGGQSYKPFTGTIPGDFSTACFPLAAAAVTGGRIKIANLDFNDPQGDKTVFSHFKKMGVSVSVVPGYALVKGGKLKATEFDLNDTPDALPVLAAAAAFAKGRSVFRNVAQARIKETDRIQCMAAELRKMGVDVEEFKDGMAVTGGTVYPSLELSSHHDHRIAMALAIAALGAGEPGSGAVSVIDGVECVSATYPRFFDDFAALGAQFYTI